MQEEDQDGFWTDQIRQICWEEETKVCMRDFYHKLFWCDRLNTRTFWLHGSDATLAPHPQPGQGVTIALSVSMKMHWDGMGRQNEPVLGPSV